MPSNSISAERESLFQKLFLSQFGLDSDNSFVFWLTLLIAGVLLGGLYWTQGNVPLVLFLIYITTIFLLSFLRIDLSLYVFMASVMFLDQYDIPGFPAFTVELGFFSNLKEIDYIPFFDAGMVSPAELHLIFLVLSTMMHLVLQINVVFKPIPSLIPFLLFLGALLFSVAYGLQRGGDFMISLWEVRALFYFCIVLLIVPHIINTRNQVLILVWIFIAGSFFKALQGVIRFIELGYTTGGHDVLTNHEDAVFIVTIILLLIGFMVFGYRGGQRYFILLALPIIMLGFYVAQRRAAYASLIVSVVLLIVLLPSFRRMIFLKYFIPIVIILLLYGAAFWNSNSTIAGPVQIIKSGFEKPDLETNARDYYSNLYREYENYNLAQTVANYPIMGIGFGKRYDQPIPLVQIRFPLRDYIPHNEIFWVIVKMGSVGFLAFWYFFNMVVTKSTRLFNVVEDPFFKALLLMITLSVINQMVVSFFDLQLTYYRNMLYLGCLIALIPAIEYIDQSEKEERESSSESSEMEGSEDEE